MNSNMSSIIVKLTLRHKKIPLMILNFYLAKTPVNLEIYRFSKTISSDVNWIFPVIFKILHVYFWYTYFENYFQSKWIQFVRGGQKHFRDKCFCFNLKYFFGMVINNLLLSKFTLKYLDYYRGVLAQFSVYKTDAALNGCLCIILGFQISWNANRNTIVMM